MKPYALLAIGFGLLLVGCGRSDLPAPTSSADLSTSASITGEAATVVRVFDGDSMEVDLGGETTEVRLLGINAPEGSECHGDAARDRLRDLIDGQSLILRDDGADNADRFGRLLRTVFVAGKSVNETLVAEGHALALQGGDPGEERLTELADRAFSDGVGMWASDACGESTPPPIRIDGVEYDPSGRDWENATEEWVEIRNDHDAPVDLSRWILRDESSTHRYEFPEGEILDPGASLRIRTGCGDDSGADRYWCADDAVWSNGGDTVILQTAAGTVVDRIRYAGDY